MARRAACAVSCRARLADDTSNAQTGSVEDVKPGAGILQPVRASVVRPAVKAVLTGRAD